MSYSFWFVGDGIEPIHVFRSKSRAEDKLNRIKEKESGNTDDYDVYSIELEELEDYPEEWELVNQNDLL
ncbi:MAG: hypothetical protein GH158_02545 [Dehalococcoidia bacterium]|nr:hypothetical protein [Dehalococcoidia bacterium]